MRPDRTLLLWAVLLAACDSQKAQDAVLAGVAVTNVTVLDVASGSRQPEMTVVWEGDRITHVVPDGTLELGEAVRRIPLPGSFALPGLWDMHAHTYSDLEARGTFLPAFVLHGVTGIREMFADCHEACAGSDSRSLTTIQEALHPSADMVATWQADIAAGVLVGPRMVRSSYIISSGPGWRSARQVAGVADARAAVVTAAQRGVDFIKVYPTLGPDEFLEVARVADSLGLQLAGHAPFALTPIESSNAGMDSFEHLDRLSQFCTGDGGPPLPGADDVVGDDVIRAAIEACSDTFEVLRRNGTHLVPTLTVLRGYAGLRTIDAESDPRSALLPSGVLALWRSAATDPRMTDQTLAAIGAQRKIAAALAMAAHEAGVSVMVGSDTPNPHVYPGAGVHAELTELVNAGFSPLDALRSATVVPAHFMGKEDHIGSVAPGYVADLLVVAADPLLNVESVREIRLVVAAGRPFTRDDLLRLRATIEDFARTF